MGRGARVVVAGPAIVGLAVLSVVVAPWGMADWQVQSVREDVRGWAGAGKAPSARAWEAVREALERAVELAPVNPSIHELLGTLHLTEPALAQSPQAAMRHLARAVELRPSAPYPWSNLLVARYRSGLTLPPFERMLAGTWLLGPAEPAVQVVVASLGLARWGESGIAAQSATAAAVAAGMRRNPMEMLRISQSRGRLFPACGYVQGDGRLAQSQWLKVCDGARRG